VLKARADALERRFFNARAKGAQDGFLFDFENMRFEKDGQALSFQKQKQGFCKRFMQTRGRYLAVRSF
jgi:hypothetical protein